VPVVRVPSEAKTSVHMSRIDTMMYLPWVSGVSSSTGPAVRSTHAGEYRVSKFGRGTERIAGVGKAGSAAKTFIGAAMPGRPGGTLVSCRRVYSMTTSGYRYKYASTAMAAVSSFPAARAGDTASSAAPKTSAANFAASAGPGFARLIGPPSSVRHPAPGRYLPAAGFGTTCSTMNPLLLE
jgi:hypothetical protein